jgi:hypothetical protein
MAKREITVELLTDTIINQGLKAAKQLLGERQVELDAALAHAAAAIAAAQAEKEKLQQQQGMLQTLLIGAVKRASQMEQIPLTEPAQKPAKGAKRSFAQAEADRQMILAALPKSKAEAISAKALAQRTGMPKNLVSLDLTKLGDKVGRQGEKSNTTYWAR